MIAVFEPHTTLKHAFRVGRQVFSGYVGSTSAVIAFEEKLREVTGAAYVLATTSGTVSLILALHGVDIKKGKTVLFPAYTFLAGANAARFLGYDVRLVDVRAETLCMDPEKIRIGPEVGAVMFVNQNGYVGEDVQRTKSICDKAGIPMIEDSSQGIGISGAGREAAVGVFSFSVPKLVTTGQGGAVFTDDPEIAKRCGQLRDHGDGWRQTRRHKHLGVNFKFNDILAAYGFAQLEDLDRLLQRRKRIFDWYRDDLDIIDYGRESTWGVIYRSAHSDAIIEKMSNHGVQAMKYYVPISRNPPYATDEEYPIAEMLYRELVFLPSSLTLRRGQIKTITRLIKEVEGRG